MSLILGMDPGFKSIGVAVYDLATDRVMLLDVIRTEKSDKKRKILASDDNLRRACEITASILDFLNRGSFVAICAESMSFPPNASAAAKVAMVWGVLACLSVMTDLPILQASPQEIKKKLCGQADASKDDVEQTLRHHFPDAAVATGVPNGLHEHAWDALSAIYGCLDGDVIRTARKMSG